MSRLSLKQIWNNKTAIAEGIRNKIFRKEDIEEVFEYRMEICKACPSFDPEGGKCAVKGTQPCCSTCGCSLGFKLRALSADCPEGKWVAITNQAVEDELRGSIK